jgi:hypothetical protein
MSTAQNNILLPHLVLKMNFFDATYQETYCHCLHQSLEETKLVMYDRQLKRIFFNIVEPLFNATQLKVFTHLTINFNDPN